MAGSSLSSRATLAGVWAIAGRLTAKAIDLGTFVLLTHFLMPGDLGLVAMAMTTIVIIEAILDLPIGAALLRIKNPTDAMFNTAFTLGVLRGIVIALLLAGLARPLASFYGYPQLVPLIAILGLAPIMRGVANPRMIVFAQRFDLRRDFIVDVTAKCFAFLAASTVAVVYENYWAVVAATIATPLVSLILSFVFAPALPKLTLTEWRHYSSIVGWNTVTQMISALNWQVERIMLPRFIPVDAFGQFAVASDVSVIPHQAISQPLIKPLIATFARFDDPKALAPVYCHVVGGYMLLMGPIFLVMGTLATPLISLVFGSQWIAAAPILAWLAWINILSIPMAPLVPLALRLNQMHFLTIRMGAEMAVRIPMTLACIAYYGIQGALIAHTAAGFAVLGVALWSVREMTGASIRMQIGSFIRPFAGLVGASLAYHHLAPVNFEGTNIIGIVWRLLVAATMLMVAYGILTTLLWLVFGRPDGAEAHILRRTGLQ
jgi:O-antigen/teichoic acid export membrane protein